jgi:cysteine desulfurase
MIYLDHNASTPVLPEVLEAMLPWLGPDAENPSSAHPAGRAARRAIDEARARVAELLGASADEIVFSSGGTESSNLAIFGVAPPWSPEGRRGVVTSAVEHPATARPCDRLAERGYVVTRLPVDAECVVGLDAARAAIDRDTRLVTVMHANNETGAVQPIAELSRLARAVGALVHTDAAQSVGKVPVRVDELGVDLLTIAGHKLYAPKGVGALYVRRGVSLTPHTLGAGHEGGVRPGTENTAFIVGLGAACAIAARSLDDEAARQARLRDALLRKLRDAVEGVTPFSAGAVRLPSTLYVGFPGVSGAALLARCAELAASTGSACHEGDERPSPVLTAMGVARREALGAVRLSLGRGTTEQDVARAADVLATAYRELSARSS